MRERARGASRSPASRIAPTDGECRPATQRAIVVLPEPDSPTIARHAPRSSSNDTSSTTGTRPWAAPRPSTERIAVPASVRSGLRSTSRGIDATSRCVYSCRGRVITCVASPSSHDAALVHHRHTVGDRRDDGEVVAHVDDRDPPLRAQPLDLLEDPCLGDDVEAGRRLVHDDDRRLAHERRRDRDALLLPAGELVRVAPCESGIRGEMHTPERLQHAASSSPTAVLRARRRPRCRPLARTDSGPTLGPAGRTRRHGRDDSVPRPRRDR